MPRITRGGPFESASGGVVMKKLVIAMLTLVTLLLGPMGLAFAQVQVTSADPSSAAQGTLSLDVTINGSGFDNSAGVKFLVTGTTDDGGITVRKVAVRNSKRLVVTIDVTDAATVNKFDIEVTLGDGRKGKGTTLFTVLRKTNDPCDVAGLDFPAFTYRQASGTGVSIYVADASGKCSRLLFSVRAKRSNRHGSAFQCLARPTAAGSSGAITRRSWVAISSSAARRSPSSLPIRFCLQSRFRRGAEPARRFSVHHDDRRYHRSMTRSPVRARCREVSIANPRDQTIIKKIIEDDGYFFSASVNGDESALYVEEQRVSAARRSWDES
jgi:hypothetical protein